MRVHLVDGTYELFRHFYGQRDEATRTGRAAVRGVLATVLQLFDDGATHVAVATDHVIESFRNALWPGYKTGAGIDPELLSVFPLLEEALISMGVATFAMVELEADDALATVAAIAAEDDRVEQVAIWTPDKDLGQCVREDGKVVQVDRRAGKIIDANGVRAKFGVSPPSIPDYLALVGDSADGFPGLPGWGAKSAAAVLACYGSIEKIPDAPGQWEVSVRAGATLAHTLATNRDLALLFKDIATLRVDRNLLDDVDQIVWVGPTPGFPAFCDRIEAEHVAMRAANLSP
ncbi:MAG TPA: 5'-3' exonuclease H3TH domain-containing protein [Acidimicrobiales bacterium]|nr:5'-3' exonuclease H3TH domain-containing protein [Acidimicrobiales bacterium]